MAECKNVKETFNFTHLLRRCFLTFFQPKNIISLCTRVRIFFCNVSLTMLPEITDLYLDIWTVGTYKLCCYPNCLVFGTPVFNDNFELQFERNSYIKIKEQHFFRYFKFFNNVLQINKKLAQQSTPEPTKVPELNEEGIPVTASTEQPIAPELTAALSGQETAIICMPNELLDTNCVTYTFQQEANILIQSKYETKISFFLDLDDLYQFFVGLYNLCFKIYCYPAKIEESIFSIVREESFSNLKNIFTLPFINMPAPGYLTEREKIFTINILRRHHKLLLKIKCCMDHFSNELDF